MKEPIRVPPAMKGGKEITIVSWEIEEGRKAAAGDVIALVEADKGILELKASADGTVSEAVKQEGDICEAGETIGWFETAAETAAGRPHDPVIPEGDVPVDLSANQLLVSRAVIRSNREIPVVRFAADIGMERCIEEKDELGVRFDALYLHYLGLTVARHPEYLRYSVPGGGDTFSVYQRPTIDVAFAVAQKERLYTPAIADVDKKEPKDIDNEIEDLIWDIADGDWRPEPSARPDGCMLLSNLGMFPIAFFDALIYPGQSSSIAFGQVEERVVVENGEMKIRPMATAFITIDHRVMNGKDAAVFLQDLKKVMETGSFKGSK